MDHYWRKADEGIPQGGRVFQVGGRGGVAWIAAPTEEQGQGRVVCRGFPRGFFWRRAVVGVQLEQVRQEERPQGQHMRRNRKEIFYQGHDLCKLKKAIVVQEILQERFTFWSALISLCVCNFIATIAALCWWNFHQSIAILIDQRVGRLFICSVIKYVTTASLNYSAN